MIYQSSQAFSLSDGIYPFINSYKAISGLINYPNNITECYKKSEDIYLEIKEMLTDLKDMGTVIHGHQNRDADTES